MKVREPIQEFGKFSDDTEIYFTVDNSFYEASNVSAESASRVSNSGAVAIALPTTLREAQ